MAMAGFLYGALVLIGAVALFGSMYCAFEAVLDGPGRVAGGTGGRSKVSEVRARLANWLEHGAECGYARDRGFEGECFCGLVVALDELAEAPE